MTERIELSTSKKISWIQFICSLIIITNHSFDYLGFGESQMSFWSGMIFSLTKMFSSSLTWIAMQTFFMLSGFLMYRDWNEKKNTGEWYAKKIRGRVKSLIIPYFLWNTIWTITFIAMGLWGIIDNNIDTTISVSNLFHGIFLAKYNEIFWFMEVLIFYVLISPLFGHVLDSKYSTVFLLLLSLLATNTIPIKPMLGEFNIIQNYYNLFFYCVGAVISIKKGDFINRIYSKRQSIFAWGGVLIVLVVLRCSKGIEILRLPNYVIMVVCLVGTYLFWIALDLVRSLQVYSFVKYSFMNYSMHKPIQQFYNKIIAKLFSPSLIGYLINLYGGCLFTVVFIVVFVKIMSKLAPRVLEVLNGGRKIL